MASQKPSTRKERSESAEREELGDADPDDQDESGESADGEDETSSEPRRDAAASDDQDERARRRARARRRRRRRRAAERAAQAEGRGRPARAGARRRRRRKRDDEADQPAPDYDEDLDDDLLDDEEDEEAERAAEWAARAAGGKSELFTDAQRRQLKRGLAVATLLIFLFYYETFCRWIGLGDTALLIDEIKRFNINSHVNNHTTAIFFGYLFSLLPIGEIALRVNFMSVVAGTIAMALMFVIVYRVTRSLLPSFLLTGAVVVMHSMWWHSTMVENYAFNAIALLTVILLLLKDEERPDSRHYYSACIVAGLAVVNHVQMGSLSVVVFIYAILQRKKDDYGLIKRWFKMGLAYLLGLLPYLLVLVRDVSQSGNFTKTIYWATGGDFQSRMFDFQLAKASRGLIMEFVLQFPTPMLVFAVLGVDYLFDKKWYPKANLAIAACFVINTFFFMQFHTWDKFAFLLPSFLITGYWGVIGARSLLERVTGKNPWWRRGLLASLVFCVVFPPIFYWALPVWGADQGVWHGRFNNNFTRNSHNCATYIANPNKRSWSDMADFAELLFAKLPQGAMFLDDDGRTYYPLHHYYQRYYQRRRDVSFLLLNSWGFENWGITEDGFVDMVLKNIDRRPIFMVSLQHPHQAIVKKLGEKNIAPKRWPLDDRHWIYKLERVDRTIGSKQGETLIVTDIYMGAHFSKKSPVLKDDFELDDPVTVKVEFLENVEPITVTFVWHTPQGETFFESDPFTIPPGNTSVWSNLDRTDGRMPGHWTVDAVSRDAVLASTGFEFEK